MNYYLVQRLSEAYPDNTKTGFDHVFSLEYMGSSEYEYRTPFESLQRMRAAKLVIVRKTIDSCEGKPLAKPRQVYFVGPSGLMVERLDAWDKWLENPRCMERSHFPEVLTGVDTFGKPVKEYYTRTIAWWAFDMDVAWTLDPAVAERLVTAYAPRGDT